MNITFKKNQGFTIIETLIAITILMISIAGPLTIAHRGLNAATNAREQLTAVFLAQDALEAVKNIRDKNVDANIDWLTGLSGCVGGTSGGEVCTIDTVGDVTITTSPSDTTLNIDNLGRYTHQAGEKSIYLRYFYIDQVVDGSEARVVVIVTWGNVVGTRTVFLNNRIFKVRL